jgi:exopolysaccharide production protein ExoY
MADSTLMPQTFANGALNFDRELVESFWDDCKAARRKRVPPAGRLMRSVAQPFAAIGLDLTPYMALLAGLVIDAVSATRAAVKPATSSGNPIGGIVKRLMDVVIAGTALLILMPLLLGVGLLIYLLDGRPILISQSRVGHGGRLFPCYKFRTMVVDADRALERHLASDPQARRQWEAMRKLNPDPRVTLLGQVLRRSSIDELPQLWNVLCGDMSCVGPRPVVPAELPRYGAQARHYLRTRPGVTGLWQVSGRSSTTYMRRVALDVFYVRNWSLWLDVFVLAMTIPALFKTGDTA